MKKRQLIKKIEKAGAIFVRHGRSHDWYTNYKKNMSQPIPRHNEINEYLAKSIIKKLS